MVFLSFALPFIKKGGKSAAAATAPPFFVGITKEMRDIVEKKS